MPDYTKFLQLCFKKRFEGNREIQESEFEFFIPGVNSGAYKPTIHIRTTIREWRARFWSWIPVNSSASITLTDEQFDELFFEMQKIKKLREAMRELKKMQAFTNDAFARLDELTQKEKDGQH